MVYNLLAACLKKFFKTFPLLKKSVFSQLPNNCERVEDQKKIWHRLETFLSGPTFVVSKSNKHTA